MTALTTTAVERFIKRGVSRGKPHASLRDGSGLCLRLLPTGVASWQFVYRLRGAGRTGTQKTVTLGSWPAIDLRHAAEEAKRLAGDVAARRDPRADINEAKRRKRAIVVTALDDYEAWVKGRQLLATGQMMSALRRGLSHLLQRDLAQLDRVALIDAIERIERSGRPGAAREFRKHLRTFLNRQLSQGRIAIDPLAGYRMPAATKEDTLAAEEHGKALTEAEIAALWRAASSIGGPFGGPGEDGPRHGPPAGRAGRHALGLDRPARLADHGPGQGDEERPGTCRSDNRPDHAAAR